MYNPRFSTIDCEPGPAGHQLCEVLCSQKDAGEWCRIFLCWDKQSIDRHQVKGILGTGRMNIGMGESHWKHGKMANWKDPRLEKSYPGSGGPGARVPYLIESRHFPHHILLANFSTYNCHYQITISTGQSHLQSSSSGQGTHSSLSSEAYFYFHLSLSNHHFTQVWPLILTFLPTLPLPYSDSPPLSPPWEILKNVKEMSLALITLFQYNSLIFSINTSIILAFSLTQIKCRASNYFTIPLPFHTQVFCLKQWQSIISQPLKWFRYILDMNLAWGDS